MKMCILSSQSGQNMTRGDKSEKYNEYFQKEWVLCHGTGACAGILAVSGIAGYVSGQKERGAENAAEFKDDGAGTALNTPASAETDTPIADEMTGYNADLVQKICQ